VAPYTVVTVAQVVSINGITDANVIDVGDIITIPQPGCCDTHTGHPISVFVSTQNGGSASSAASSASSEEVNDLKKNIEGSTAAIVIFVLLFIVALVWAVVATVIAIVLHLKSGNVSASDESCIISFSSD
jgi:hypothetical protein